MDGKFLTLRKPGVVALCIILFCLYVVCMLNRSRSKSQHTTKVESNAKDEDAYSWLETAETITDELEEDVLRCRAMDLGCFTLLSSSSEIHVENSVKYSRLSMCFEQCFSGNGSFVAFDETTESCYCGRHFRGLVTSRDMSPEISSDLAKNCESARSVRVYLIKEACERGITEEFVDSDRVGCVPIPASPGRNMAAFRYPDTTIQQCVLLCENNDYRIAMPALHLDACICSNLQPVFETPEKMLQGMHACPEGGNAPTLPVFQTLARSSRCPAPQFLPPGKGGTTVLASFPGSGNTWVRQLIEKATGYYTGSRYTDGRLIDGGLVGEMVQVKTESGRVVVVKDHVFGKKILSRYRAAILVVRNPYKALLSEFTRWKSSSHVGLVSNEIYASDRFKEHVNSNKDAWYRVAENILQQMRKVMVVYYENIAENPVREMRRIVAFLPPDEAGNPDELDWRLMCMNLDLKGNFKRPSKNLDRDPFDAFMRNAIDKNIRMFDDLMAKYNQAPVPDSYYLT